MADLETVFNQAVEHQQAGSLVAAENLYREVLRRQSGHIGALANLGAVLDGLGRFEEAIETYRLGLSLAPRHAALHNNLGNVYKELGALEAAAKHYRKAMAADSRNVEARNNLGAVLQGLGRFEEAERYYRRALSIRPDFLPALDNLGDILHVQDRNAEARQCYERALALEPRDALRVKLAMLIPPIYRSNADIDAERTRLARALDAVNAAGIGSFDPLREVNATPFYLAFHGRNDRDLAAQIASLFAGALPRRVGVPSPLRAQRLRVGLISRFWVGHAVGERYARLVGALAGRDVDVTVFAANASDVPRRFVDDDRIHTVRLPPNLGVARRMIGDRRLDFLVYTDIGMDPFTYFLAFTRLARVQCLLPGHPVTSGIPTIDYFFSSSWTEPDDAKDHYSETLVCFPELLDMPRRPEPVEKCATRASLGLPKSGRLYVCPVLPFKIHPDFDPLLGGILERDRQARIVLFRDPREHGHERTLKARFARNLGSLARRIHFIPYQPYDKFREILVCADAVLDSHPVSAGGSIYTALGLGVPVVTLPGPFLRGRTALGCYRRLGIEDAVATSPEDYVARAVGLAGDAGRRERLGAAILERGALLFENEALADAMVEFFESVASVPEAAE